MLINTPSLEEDLVDEDESLSETSQLHNQLSNQNEQTTNENGSWYKGSTFAGVLVIILFVVWFLYRIGCLGHD